MKIPLRIVAVLAILVAFSGAQVFATPHMLGMDCAADCPECVTECCCGPAASGELPVSTESPRVPDRVGARPSLAAVPILPCRVCPGAPPRGPPA